MKNKKVIIGIAAAAVVVLCVTLVLLVRSEKKEEELVYGAIFEDSRYPCQYAQDKGDFVFRITGDNLPELAWNVEVGEEDYVEVSKSENDTKEKTGEAAYVIHPKSIGQMEVSFVKKNEIAGFSYEVVRITVPVYVSDVNGTLTASALANCKLQDYGGEVGGTSTSYPYLLWNEESGNGKILFLDGASDWKLDADSEESVVEVNGAGVDANHIMYVQLGRRDEDGTAGETLFTISSEAANVTEHIRAKVQTDGKVLLSKE